MKKSKKWVFPALMIMPATLFIICISLWPVVQGIYMSFTSASLMNLNAQKFIGIENYLKIIKDKEFISALVFTFIFVFFGVILTYVMGMAVALLMNRPMKGRNIIRALLLITWVIPAVVGTNSWMWILNDQTGVINTFLMKIGLIKSPILFLSDAKMARMTVILFDVWKSFPFMSMVLLASMQNIPADIYESVKLDGAGAISTFFNITFPLVRRESMTALTLSSIWAFNNFDYIFLLTKGGPANQTQVMSIYSYYTAFSRSNLGYASAISVVMMIIMLFISRFYIKFNQEED